MNKNFSNNIPPKTTAGCPSCGYINPVRKDNLLYYRDTMVIKGINCLLCGNFIPVNLFTRDNSTIMHG